MYINFISMYVNKKATPLQLSQLRYDVMRNGVDCNRVDIYMK